MYQQSAIRRIAAGVALRIGLRSWEHRLAFVTFPGKHACPAGLRPWAPRRFCAGRFARSWLSFRRLLARIGISAFPTITNIPCPVKGMSICRQCSHCPYVANALMSICRQCSPPYVANALQALPKNNKKPPWSRSGEMRLCPGCAIMQAV